LIAPPAEESDLVLGPTPANAEGNRSRVSSGAVVQHSIAPWLFLLVGVFAAIEAGLRMRAAVLARKHA
jgi:hypothetical protein